MYYGAIIIDLMLRCTWSLKLSPHLDHFNDLEGGIFVMEFLEVLRRWMWIFFRVETEWGKRYLCQFRMPSFTNAPAVRTNRGPPPDEILLEDINGSIDSPLSPAFPERRGPLLGGLIDH